MCRSTGLIVMVALVSGILAGTAATGQQSPDASLLLEGMSAAQRGLRYLERRQLENGSWQDDPAITGLVVTGMLGSGLDEYDVKRAVVERALRYIRSHVQPDGGIYDRFYAGYSTSICAMALLEAGRPEDRALLEGAKRFLLDAQADESEGLDAQDPWYGGWGYEPHPSGEGMHRPDMSNTQFALEAIHKLEQMAEEDRPLAGDGKATRTRTELAYDRAIAFLERCQNLKAHNDQPWAGNDGGFVYRPGESKAGETPEGGLRSYAGMTYAGLKSMIYARLGPNDPRVRAAWDWARRHWSVTENSGLGQQGLYYYYVTMARALNAYGRDVVVGPDGERHEWRRELLRQLLKVQRADGSWVNGNSRWMEGMPELVTAYCVLTIEQATAPWRQTVAASGP